MPVNIKIIPSLSVKNLRKILYPFSLPYQAITSLRNLAFEKGLLSAKTFPKRIVGIGNLSTGGTGKTPMTEYVLRLLEGNGKTAVLSRGYGRKTRGFLEVNQNDDVHRVGDEPLQLKSKFTETIVAVDERRARGIEQLLQLHGGINTIILDDVYQHRSVKPGLMILLTAYGSPFFNDFSLPAGDLRESRQGAKRADLVVVTKCPAAIGVDEMEEICRRIRRYTTSTVFFSTLTYDGFVYGTKKILLETLKNKPVTVVSGIAKPAPFIKYLKDQGLSFEHKAYSDHHNFSPSEIKMLDTKACVLTTEKDYVRLKPNLSRADLYYLPVRHQFLDNAQDFDQVLKDYCRLKG